MTFSHLDCGLVQSIRYFNIQISNISNIFFSLNFPCCLSNLIFSINDVQCTSQHLFFSLFFLFASINIIQLAHPCHIQGSLKIAERLLMTSLWFEFNSYLCIENFMWWQPSCMMRWCKYLAWLRAKCPCFMQSSSKSILGANVKNKKKINNWHLVFFGRQSLGFIQQICLSEFGKKTLS